jgi:centrosomal protein CEP290
VQKVEGLENDLRAKDKDLLQRDRIITELRLRLPASAERDQLIAKVTTTTTSFAPPGKQQQEDSAGQEYAMKVASATMATMQVTIGKK